MTTLILKKTASLYGIGSDDDYVVLNAGQTIGRIMLHPQAPQGQSWFWTITARNQPPSIHNRGYCVTREQAMGAFKAKLVASEEPATEIEYPQSHW